MANTSAEFKIVRGVTFERSFVYKDPTDVPIDLTGMTVVFGCRKAGEDSATISITSGTPTALGSSVTVTDAAGGAFDVKVTDEETATILWDEGNWWLNLVQAGDVRRIGYGDLVISRP